MPRFDNPYDEAEYRAAQAERFEAENERRMEMMLEEYRERRREKEADEGYEECDPKRSDWLERKYEAADYASDL